MELIVFAEGLKHNRSLFIEHSGMPSFQNFAQGKRTDGHPSDFEGEYSAEDCVARLLSVVANDDLSRQEFFMQTLNAQIQNHSLTFPHNAHSYS